MNNVLFIAVHPDDETLGCGGTILKHKSGGDKIFWLVVTGIDEAHGWKKDVIKNRDEEIKTVARLYGFDNVYLLDFPALLLDRISMMELTQKIAAVVNKIKPGIIYMPNRSDVHTDHKVTFQAAYNCTKNFRFPFVKRVLMYETLSETEIVPALPGNAFIPNVFINISEFLDKKLEIMQVYKSEVMKEPFPRSLQTIEALARLRGSFIGKKYAEGFVLLKEIL